MPTDVIIAISRPYPDPDGDLLPAALRRAGARVRVAAWDDPSVDWAAPDVVLIRSTWDYIHRLPEYLTWLATCRRTANPPDVARWSTDKHYLTDLAAAGVPVVPTAFLEPGDAYDPGPGQGQVVVKPAVSAGAADTGRFERDDPRAAALAAELLAAGRSVLVQPYLDGVTVAGETALVFLGGTFSHAARKPELLRGTGLDEVLLGAASHGLITAVPAEPAQIDVARAALAAVPGGQEQLAYARVDLVPGPDGPVVLELELVEPDLFLRLAPEPAQAADRLAAAAVRAVAGPVSASGAPRGSAAGPAAG